MARQAIPVLTLAAYGGKDEDSTQTVADNPNGDQFTHPGGDVLLHVNNPTAGSLVATVQSVATGRTFEREGDIVITTAAGETSNVAIPDKGFDQGLGVVHIDSAALLEFTVIKMTPTP